MTQTIISSNKDFTESYPIDYKTLEYMLAYEDAEKYSSVDSLLENYDAIDIESLIRINAITKLPLYVVHGIKSEGISLEYATVYDACLNLIGYLD